MAEREELCAGAVVLRGFATSPTLLLHELDEFGSAQTGIAASLYFSVSQR